MSIAIILATITCDGCGKQFKVELDPAYTPPPKWSLFDVAEDAVRGGHIHQGGITDFCSVQDDKMLCTPCTNAADANGDDDDFS